MSAVKKLLSLTRNTIIGFIILLSVAYVSKFLMFGDSKFLNPYEEFKVLIDPSYYLKTDVGLYNTVYPVKKQLSILYNPDLNLIKPIDQQTAILYLNGKREAEILEYKNTLIFVKTDEPASLLSGLDKQLITKLEKKSNMKN